MAKVRTSEIPDQLAEHLATADHAAEWDDDYGWFCGTCFVVEEAND